MSGNAEQETAVTFRAAGRISSKERTRQKGKLFLLFTFRARCLKCLGDDAGIMLAGTALVELSQGEQIHAVTVDSVAPREATDIRRAP